ncbi:MAG: hypothetical protein AAF184_11800 [Pseudomonadota bacterium]
MPPSSKTLFSGRIDIEFSQFYIEAEDEYSDIDSAFANQVNGLCGAAQPGSLFFTARPKDAVIALEVVLFSTEPPIDSSYSEIVEVSFCRDSQPVLLCQWAHEDTYPLDLPAGPYRVRYCIDGLEKEYDEGVVWEHERIPIPGQRYLIQFWPGHHKPDTILQQTSDQAAYWHAHKN